MEHSDLLNTLAQIALGTLGFTGVVVALKHSADDWNNYEKIRFQALVTTTLTSLVGSLLPQIISMATEDNSQIWRLANLGIGIMHLANFSSIIYTTIKYKIKPDFKGFKRHFRCFNCANAYNFTFSSSIRFYSVVKVVTRYWNLATVIHRH